MEINKIGVGFLPIAERSGKISGEVAGEIHKQSPNSWWVESTGSHQTWRKCLVKAIISSPFS